MKKCLWLILFLVVAQWSYGQSARERSVEVSATVQENPPQINFSWTADNTATAYSVYKKTYEATDWGNPIAVLPGTATTFLEENINIGEAYEYAFFKKEYAPIKDTICVPAGTEVKLRLEDMYGIGLCCNFGFGYFQVEACGSLVAEGTEFGFNDEVIFEVCDDGNACTDVIITVSPDMFPNSTSWILSNNQTGVELGQSGFVGAFISERPKYGFIYAGIKAPAIDQRGKILILIDDEYSQTLVLEIERLRLDMIRDGWQVLTKDVNKNDAVTEVKALIQEVYMEHNDLSALLLLGHIPVPYSGDMYPDTHAENHQGAWSADTYYAELDGVWTDESADITTAFFERNHNIPGDGKFDQSAIPTGIVELACGRIDFHNMPAFALDEIELTRQYLNKNNRWRNGEIVVERRALVDDNFGQAFAAPAASGWRNFAPMFGTTQVDELDYFETMREQSYLWSYGCGSGTHISSDGIGFTADFANDSLLSVFTMLFGSQFGDWDNENNFLRAPLASGLTLTNCWAGNPAWYFHDMALGQHIGASARRTLNSALPGDLPGPQLVHATLLGDPTLRMHPVLSASDLALSSVDTAVNLQWMPSTDLDIAGYYVYRADSLNGLYVRVSPDLITTLNYQDIPTNDGTYYYMLRAVKLETSGSGTYYNLSPGLIGAVNYVFIVDTKELVLEKGFDLLPNPSAGLFTLALQTDQITSNRPIDLQILNDQGQVVFTKKINPSNAQMIDLQNWPNGVYIFKLSDGEKSWVKKGVILK